MLNVCLYAFLSSITATVIVEHGRWDEVTSYVPKDITKDYAAAVALPLAQDNVGGIEMLQRTMSEPSSHCQKVSMDPGKQGPRCDLDGLRRGWLFSA